MTSQPALAEFWIDYRRGIHFYLYTPTTFLVCQPRELYAHYRPKNAQEEECQRFLRAYGLRLEKSKQSDNLGLNQAAIMYLLGHGWELLAGGNDLDPWSGNVVTMRKAADWPGAGERGWETCLIQYDSARQGTVAVLERDGQQAQFALDLIWTDAEVQGESDRALHRLLAAYGWLVSLEVAQRILLAFDERAAPAPQTVAVRYLMCHLLRQGWEPVEYGPMYRGPAPGRRARFRRPFPGAQTSPAVAQAWAERLAAEAGPGGSGPGQEK